MGTGGVAPHEAGLAGGLLDAGRQCGGSVGLAALSTIAVAVTGTAEASGAGTAAALVEGYGRAFTVTGGLLLTAAPRTAFAVSRVRPEDTMKPGPGGAGRSPTGWVRHPLRCRADISELEAFEAALVWEPRKGRALREHRVSTTAAGAQMHWKAEGVWQNLSQA